MPAGTLRDQARASGELNPSLAEPLYELFCDQIAAAGVHPVARGRFAADMKVALVNDGPVTLILDTP